jgi:hypothetical protein
VVEVGEDAHARVPPLIDAGGPQRVGDLGREAGEDEREVPLLRVLRQLGEADEGRGVEAADALEVERQAAEPRRARVGQPVADAGQEPVAGAEEDVALQPEDVALVRKSDDGRGAAGIAVSQAVRCDAGMPSRVIRLSTEQATRASVFWAGESEPADRAR